MGEAKLTELEAELIRRHTEELIRRSELTNSGDDPKVADSRAYPTDARVRQKAIQAQNKLEGKPVKKRKQYIEEPHDDCGEDLSGLGKEEPDKFHCFDDDTEDEKWLDPIDECHFNLQWFAGSHANVRSIRERAERYHNMVGLT